MSFDWGDVISKWGYPTAVIIVVGTLLRPYIKRYLDRAEKQSDAVQAILANQLEKAEKAQDTLVKQFSGAIEENNRVSRRIADALDELLKQHRR